ncbi:hypothetical protein C0431_01345 [bacterium]|jgi:hypothetical protein|nr:hypothetical protein [bacterium]
MTQMMTKQSLLIIAGLVCTWAMFGCEDGAPPPPASSQPPAEQKVVMVPSHKEGQAPSTTPADPNTAENTPLAPGSKPDVDDEPGDLGNPNEVGR